MYGVVGVREEVDGAQPLFDGGRGMSGDQLIGAGDLHELVEVGLHVIRRADCRVVHHLSDLLALR